MSAARSVPRARVALALALALAPAGAAAAAGAAAPEYEQRLRLPTAGDAFWQPLGVHADLHTGELFVCDRNNDRVVIFGPRGVFRYQIRGGEVFRSPLDVAVDPDGELFVLGLREGVHVVARLDFDGRFLDSFPLSGLPADAAPPEPVSLALSRAGDRLYALDQANVRMWIADRAGRVTGSVDLAEGLSEEARFEQFLGHVDVYGDTVLVALPMEGTIRLFGPDGTPRGAVGTKGTSPCQTAFPVAAGLDEAGNVIVLDKQRNLVMVWRSSDNACLLEFTGIGASPGRVYQPSDLALDGTGRVYVGQGFDNRVQVFRGLGGASGAAPAGAVEEAP